MIPYLDLPRFHVGPFTLTVFGLTAMLAVIIGSRQTLARAKSLGLAMEPMNQLLNHAVGWGLVGAHLVAVLVYHPARIEEEGLGVLLKFWDGLASSGGIIVGALAAWAAAVVKKLRPAAVLDSFAYGLAHAWIFGRTGCFLVHDHPGRITDFALAVRYPDAPTGMGRHDLGLYEIPLAIALSLLLRWLAKRPWRPGQATALFLALYAPVRFGLDFLRALDTSQPDPRYAGLTPAQYVAILVFAGATLYLVRVTKRPAVSVGA